jgi:hypothetical protein
MSVAAGEYMATLVAYMISGVQVDAKRYDTISRARAEAITQAMSDADLNAVFSAASSLWSLRNEVKKNSD